MRAPKPGFFAPKGEKALYRAFEARDAAAIAHVADEFPPYALAASSVAGLLAFEAGDVSTAKEQLTRAFATGAEPSADPFIAKYVHMEMQLLIAPGVTAELSLDRSAIGLALAELHQQTNDLAGAADIVEQLEPTTYAAVSLAELYLQLDRYADVVTLTDGIVNGDDATALLCVFRGVALREQHFFDAARESFKEALKRRIVIPSSVTAGCSNVRAPTKRKENAASPARISNRSWPRTPPTTASRRRWPSWATPDCLAPRATWTAIRPRWQTHCDRRVFRDASEGRRRPRAALGRCQNEEMPPHVRDETRIELDVDGRALTLYECRPPWRPEDESSAWTRNPIVRFRYTQKRGTWELYWSDRNSEFIDSTSNRLPRLQVLLDAVDADETAIFRG